LKKKAFTKELILYIVFGVCTTLVNTLMFWLLNNILGIDYLVANIAAWLTAVVFAYITNKLFVFGTKNVRGKALAAEAGKFFGARVLSLIVDELGMWLLVDVFGMAAAIGTIDLFGVSADGTVVAKIIMNVIVIIINYVMSKLLVFKKDKK